VSSLLVIVRLVLLEDDGVGVAFAVTEFGIVVFPLDHFDELLTQVPDLVLSDLTVLVGKLGPDLDSETTCIVATLIEDSHASQHVDFGKLAGDDVKHKCVPELLHNVQGGRLKVNPELTALLVDFVLPLGRDAVRKHAQSIDSLLPLLRDVIPKSKKHVRSLLFEKVAQMHKRDKKACFDLHLAQEFRLVEEEVVDVVVGNVVPSICEADSVVEPSHLFH